MQNGFIDFAVFSTNNPPYLKQKMANIGQKYF